MTTYRVKTGHDEALEDLVVLNPQPNEEHAGGIQYTRVTRSLSGSIKKEGPYFEFNFGQLNATTYDTVLTAFGVASTDTANVTVYIRDDDMKTWVRKNGVAYKPLPGDGADWFVRPRNITITVTDLETAS